MTERLTNSQIIILRSVFLRSGGRPVMLDADWRREFLPGLLRRGFIEVWHRQRLAGDVASRGPFVTLSAAGNAVAARFINPAPRGFSGAEKRA
jgi:hypothetical protein